MGLLQNAVDRLAQLAPGRELLLERGTPLLGDVVITALAAGFLLLPFAGDESRLFKLVQAGIERAFAPLKRAIGVAMHGRRELVAVHRLATQQREDEERQGAF